MYISCTVSHVRIYLFIVAYSDCEKGMIKGFVEMEESDAVYVILNPFNLPSLLFFRVRLGERFICRLKHRHAK